MFGVLPKLSRAYVESQVNDIDVMAYYLGISSSTVEECIHQRLLIRSPLRADNNPTCGFYVASNGKLRFNDFAGYFHGDMYDLVGYRTLLDANDPREFMLILHRICKDFRLWYYSMDRLEHAKGMTERVELKPKEYVKITVQPREWYSYDKRYWKQYGLDEAALTNAFVYPVYSAWINEKLVYVNNTKDPCYAIFHGALNGEEQWKLYFPKRKSSAKLPRFLTNTRRMQNMATVKKGQYGIITKAIKDALVLNSYGIQAVALAAESIYPSPKELEFLKSNWGTIYSLLDFDLTGIRMANALRKKAGIRPFFFTTGRFSTLNYMAKDTSDFRAVHGDRVTKNLLDLVVESNGNLDRDFYEELDSFLTPF